MVQKKSIKDNVWIANTGACAHITNNMKGMIEMRAENARTATVRDS